MATLFLLVLVPYSLPRVTMVMLFPLVMEHHRTTLITVTLVGITRLPLLLPILKHRYAVIILKFWLE